MKELDMTTASVEDILSCSKDDLSRLARSIYNLRQLWGLSEADSPVSSSLKPYFDEIESEKSK